MVTNRIRVEVETVAAAESRAGGKVHIVATWVHCYKLACDGGDAEMAEKYRAKLHAYGKTGTLIISPEELGMHGADGCP